MTGAIRRNDSSLKTSCASTTCCRPRTYAMRCSNTLSKKMIVCDRLARKIVLTIKLFLSSNGIDKHCEKRMAVIVKLNGQVPLFLSPRAFASKGILGRHRLGCSLCAPETCAFSGLYG